MKLPVETVKKYLKILIGSYFWTIKNILLFLKNKFNVVKE